MMSLVTSKSYGCADGKNLLLFQRATPGDVLSMLVIRTVPLRGKTRAHTRTTIEKPVSERLRGEAWAWKK